jgi:hypothetical protein
MKYSLIIFTLIFQILAFAAPNCLANYKTKVEFIKFPQDTYMALRSNVSHYWDFALTIKDLAKYKSLYALKGTGIGDFHMLNVGDIELPQARRKVGLVDIDDAGNNIPFLIDIARQLVASQLVPRKMNLNSLLDAYFYGLNNTPISSKFIKKIKNNNAEDFANLKNKFLAKNTAENKFSQDSGALPIDSAPESVKKTFSDFLPEFEVALKNYDAGIITLDTGYRIKTSGGSKGVPRFLFLVQKSNGEQEIIEFKKLMKSSAEVFATQGSLQERFSKASHYFRPKETTLGLFTLIEKNETAFIARTKNPSFIDFKITKDMSKSDSKDLEDFTNYSFNFYGLSQKEQLTPEQITWLNNNHAELKELLLEFTQKYLKTIYAENSK